MLDKDTNTLYFTKEEYFGAIKLTVSGKKIKVATKVLAEDLRDRFYDMHNPYAAITVGDIQYTIEVLSRRGRDNGSPSRYYYSRGSTLYTIDNTPSKTSLILTTLLDVKNVSPSYVIEYDTAADANRAEAAFRRILEINSFVIINSKTKIKLSNPPERFLNKKIEEVEEEEIIEEKKPAGIFNRSMLKGIKK